MQSQGFSLIEILIALFLITGIMLLLLNQELKLINIYRDIKLKNMALLYLDNASENILVDLNYTLADKQFILEKNSTTLTITHRAFDNIKLSRTLEKSQ